jgi:hypothetical protein
MDRINNWAATIADGLVERVRAYLITDPTRAVEDALECVLSQSCAGPMAIELAKRELGIEA